MQLSCTSTACRWFNIYTAGRHRVVRAFHNGTVFAPTCWQTASNYGRVPHFHHQQHDDDDGQFCEVLPGEIDKGIK